MGFDAKEAGRGVGIKPVQQGLKDAPGEFDSVVHGIAAVTRMEIQDSLFALWFAKIKSGLPRRSYKVPFRIQALPCGCVRERTNEVDANNLWHVKRKKGPNKRSVYVHKECGTELDNNAV